VNVGTLREKDKKRRQRESDGTSKTDNFGNILLSPSLAKDSSIYVAADANRATNEVTSHSVPTGT
jgi:hypothetical protein